MKKYLALLMILTIYGVANSQVNNQPKMHRIQDTTLSESGWYYAKSTEGNFSIELPIPFNDFSLTFDEITSYAIGGKSQEGLSFLALEAGNKNKNEKIDLDKMVEDLQSENTSITNISKSNDKNSTSISFEGKSTKNGSYVKYISFKDTVFMLIIEYPISMQNVIVEYKDRFFSSFKITSN